MKQFTKAGIANTLQVAAVLILFGYPGCSPDKTSSNSSYSAKSPAAADTTRQLKPVDLKSLEGEKHTIVLKP
ncbi:MAG: hypothetical protein IPP96_14300 [Chitinophagaceae bacterium]|nr:hypothetical protein [Chitinophagaceae bacterium]